MAASSSSSLSLYNFLTSLIPPVSPPRTTAIPASFVSLPRTTAIPAATTGLSLETPARIPEVAFPWANRSSLMWFKSAYNVQVITEENEHEEKLLSRFRREVFRAGVLQECRRRRFFENSHDKRKRKAREAARRNRKRPPRSSTKETNQETPAKNKDSDEVDDNWDDFDVDLPY